VELKFFVEEGVYIFYAPLQFYMRYVGNVAPDLALKAQAKVYFKINEKRFRYLLREEFLKRK